MNEPHEEPMSAPKNDPKIPSSGREAYNVVTDIVVGPNVRMRDNLLQGAVILVCAVVGVLIGHFFIKIEDWNGAVIGGLAGLLVGLFGSGIFLMVYRGFRHFRGKHD